MLVKLTPVAKFTNIFGPLKFQNGKLAAKPLYTWRVAEAFNYPSNNQKKTLNHW